MAGGIRTFLVRGNTFRSSSNWERYTIEAVGDEIRVTDNEALLMRVTDDTYFSGKTFISAFVNALTLIDNIEMESITTIMRTPAASTGLPLDTGFDDLVLRDGVLQHPNIDLLEGSQGFINHPARPQLDGTQGNILRLLGGGGPNPRSTVGLTGLEDQSDFRLEFDLKGSTWDHVVAFRASDVDNGYQFVFNNGTVSIYQVAGGIRTFLNRGVITGRGGSDWGRYTIEAVGNEINVTDGEGLLIEITDATYASGRFLFSAFRNAVILIDNLLIEATNEPPIADAGTDRSVAKGTVVALDGSGSFDDATATADLIYSWNLLSRPADSLAELVGTDTAAPSLATDEAGDYVVELVVNDGTIDSEPDEVTITATNTPPTADAGGDQTVLVREQANLDGGKSSDPDGDPISYSWNIVSRPDGSTATLSGANSSTSSLVPDVAGGYLVQPVVDDGTVSSSPGVVTVTAITPGQAIQELASLVNSLGLPKKVLNSLTAPLKNAASKLSDDNAKNDGAACGKLNAFTNQVNAKEGNGQLTAGQADQLLQAAEAIKGALGCH